MSSLVFNVVSCLGTVESPVSLAERDAEPDRAVILSRSYEIIVEDFWDAVIDNERLPR